MSKRCFYGVVLVLLGITVAGLKSDEPASPPCSVADLDDDCDVDLRDYAGMQNAFSGPLDSSFDVVGTWDMFVFFPDRVGMYQQAGPFIFYGNGVVSVFGGGAALFRLYQSDGQQVTFDYEHSPCGYQFHPLALKFVDANELQSEVFNTPQPFPAQCGHYYFRAFRRP